MTPIRKSLPPAFALLALVLLAGSHTAGAAHVVPKGASPVRVPLVIAYNQCTSPDTTHNAPLAFPSCRFPQQSSSSVTVGTPDANGAAPNGAGYMRLDVKTTAPEEVLIRAEVSDVRCRPATNASVCTRANVNDGPDYTGELQFNAMIRITDHYNGPNGDQPATVQDIPMPVTVPCVATDDTSTGGFCSSTFSPQPGIPPQDLGGHRTVVGIQQIHVFDGGPDGSVATPAGNAVFARQGLFVP
jgi:hypothetical protein